MLTVHNEDHDIDQDYFILSRWANKQALGEKESSRKLSEYRCETGSKSEQVLF